MKNSHTIYLEISIILVAILFFGCSNVSSNKSDSEGTTQNQEQNSVDNASKDTVKNTGESLSAANMSGNLLEEGLSFESTDYYEDYNEREVNYIQLNDSSIIFSGEGAFVSDNKISISKPGTYVIFGTLKEGQIIVEETTGGVVQLILKNATIHCENSAPIYIKEAGKVIISIAPGTKNMLTDGLADHDRKLSDPNATIYCSSDLTMNGAGSLVINATYQNAISSKGVLKIVEGDYEICAVGHGIIGKEAVLIDASRIKIASGRDGIRTNNDTENSKGLIFINRGEFMITSEQDGIQADKYLVLQNGNYEITTGGGSTGSVKKENKEEPLLSELMEITEYDYSRSAKGLKSGEDILIGNGTFTLDSADDAIHSDGSISIENGSFTIASGDDGIHADASLTIAKAKIALTSSYEGIEGSKIAIKSGSLNIISSEDGINVSGGLNSKKENNDKEEDTFIEGSGILSLSGGIVIVSAGGDGIDSRGLVTMTGGTLIIEGSSNDANGAIVYNDVFEMSGGTLLAVGSSGMTMAPSITSKQKSILLNLKETVEGKTVLCLLEGEDRIPVMAYLPSKSYQSVVYSSPLLLEGKSYTLSTGGSTTPKEGMNLYTPKAYEDGIDKAYITIHDTLTTYGEMKAPIKLPLEGIIE
ncbi:carbohydrate-binding domain-containing protein [Lachnoclostridium sp.]|nr:carbohydrate-binding domain-containing protein [Lachnoclostridium sp.]